MTSKAYIRSTQHSDEFGRQSYATALMEYGLEQPDDVVVVIGVHGQWGSGKTEFLKQMQKALHESNASQNRGTHFVDVWFQPWKYERRADVGVGLVYSILNSFELEKKQDLTARDKLRRGFEKAVAVGKRVGRSINFAAGMSGANASVNAGEVVDSVLNELEPESFSYQTEVDELLNDLAKYVKEWSKKRRTVIFIDDLDRCLPHQMMRTMEAIQLFIHDLPVIAVVAIDREAFNAAVEHRFGSTFNRGASYIEKIVDIPFDLTRPTKTQISDKHASDFAAHGLQTPNAQIVIELGLLGNPRLYERFINRINVISKLPKASDQMVTPETQALLALLTIVQMRFPALYGVVAELPAKFRIYAEACAKSSPNEPERLISLGGQGYEEFFENASEERMFFSTLGDTASRILTEANVPALMNFLSGSERA